MHSCKRGVAYLSLYLDDLDSYRDVKDNLLVHSEIPSCTRKWASACKVIVHSESCLFPCVTHRSTGLPSWLFFGRSMVSGYRLSLVMRLKISYGQMDCEYAFRRKYNQFFPRVEFHVHNLMLRCELSSSRSTI